MKLLISGYYGFGNEGDELILQALLRACGRHRESIVVLSADPEATRVRHSVRAVDRWKPATVLTEIFRCQALISGGGGLVQDLSGPMTPGYYLGLVAAARLLGKRAVLLGQGFGPVRRTWNPRLCRWVLPGMNLIVPRDPQGLAWCRGYRVPERKLVQGADLVWTLPEPARRAGRDWAVCLRADWLQHEIPLWLNRLVQCAHDHGRRLRFVSLGNRGDRDLLRRMAQRIGNECDFVSAPETPADECFAGCELVASMRYHGLILGARAGAAVTGFGADDKIRHLLEELEQPVLEAMLIEAGLRDIVARLSALQNAAARNAECLRARAEAGLNAAREALELS